MSGIHDGTMQRMLSEISMQLSLVYQERLKEVILYGSVARGTQTEESDIDIMVLVDVSPDDLKMYEDKLGDVSTEAALKYMKVFSIVDVSYQEFEDWKHLSPFYRNVSQEGIVIYAA